MTSTVSPKLLTALARYVRATPGVGAMLGPAVSYLRRNNLLTDIVWRVFDPGRGAGQSIFPFHPGRYVCGRDVARLPIVGVVGTGLTDAEADELLNQLAELQHRLRSFRPLLVLDRPIFATARRHGFVLEVLTSAAAWPGSSSTWATHVGARIASIIEDYRLWTVLTVAQGRLAPVDIAILESLHDYLPEDLDVSAAEPFPARE